jgi:hypothetical protein
MWSQKCHRMVLRSTSASERAAPLPFTGTTLNHQKSYGSIPGKITEISRTSLALNSAAHETRTNVGTYHSIRTATSPTTLQPASTRISRDRVGDASTTNSNTWYVLRNGRTPVNARTSELPSYACIFMTGEKACKVPKGGRIAQLLSAEFTLSPSRSRPPGPGRSDGDPTKSQEAILGTSTMHVRIRIGVLQFSVFVSYWAVLFLSEPRHTPTPT